MYTTSSAISVKNVHSAETSFVLTNLFSNNSSRSGGDLPENDGTNENTERMVATNCDPLYFYYQNNDIRTATPKSIITPKQNDVIIGKGHSIQNHPGNKYYHSLVERTKPIYDSVSKNMKGAQAKMIVNQITQELNPPGRFLKENKVLGIWEVIERKVAVKKSWQALRDWKPRKLGAAHHRKAKKSPQLLKRKDTGETSSASDTAGAHTMGPNFEVVDKKNETLRVVDPHLKCISLKDSEDEDLGFLNEADALVW